MLFSFVYLVFVSLLKLLGEQRCASHGACCTGSGVYWWNAETAQR